MAKFSKDRRQLLLGTVALFGGAAAVATLAGSRPARALTIYETPTNTGIGLTYSNRCGGASEHTRLIAELQAKLKGDPKAASETASCPLCGCAVTVSR